MAERLEKGVVYRLVDLNTADAQAIEPAAVDHLLARTLIIGAGIFPAAVGMNKFS